MKIPMLPGAVSALAVLTTVLSAQSGNPLVATGQYNAGRTAANPNETILNTSNVNQNQFGKLFSWTVDGWVFAQPLYVPGVLINGVSTNVLYVATMHNSVYAFNADQAGSAPLWTVNFGTSVTAPTANGCPASSFTGSELGILSTPVVDPTTSTLYAVSASPATGGFVHFLHAIDLSTHAEKFGGPVQIKASVPGTGYDSQNGTVTLSSSSTDVQRTALLLANGSVYAGFGNCGPDVDYWHGWVLGYSALNLQVQTALFNSTPNGGQGGIWQSARGLVADSAGDIYFNTGNATDFSSKDNGVTTGNSTTDAANGNYPMRFIQATPAGQYLGSFPPAHYSTLNTYDLDFSSSGPLLIPGTTLLITGGKDGVIYVFNSTNMSTPVQSFQATGSIPSCSYTGDGCDQIHDLAFSNNMLYVWGSHDYLKAFSFNPSTNQFNTTAASTNANYQTPYRAATLAVSSDSGASGSNIVWAITPPNTAVTPAVPPVVHAFDATNVATELWNSTQDSSRDALPSFPRFVEPTVANGRVYVATQSDQVAVYGLLTDFTLSTSETSVTDMQGSSASFTVTVKSLTNSSTSATLSATGLPPHATIKFHPPSISGSGTSTVTIKTKASTPPGTYNVILSASRGGVVRNVNVSLTVQTADVTAPQWSCCNHTENGSSSTITYSAWDTQSGIKSIVPSQLVNATVSIPPFTPGTTGTIKFSVTESGWTSYAKIVLTDVAGNVSYIDPIYLDATREPGKPVPYDVKDVTHKESIITIANGSPGLKHVRIQVNNGEDVRTLELTDLTDGETKVVNIRSLVHHDGSTVTITPLGKPGGSALFTFANVAMNGSTQ